MNTSQKIRQTVIFAMLGSIFFCSKIIMEILPNIHILGMLTMTYTLVYRTKGLIPIYIGILLNGLYAGFATWWIAYLYIWAILWGITMLLPKKMPKKLKYVIYPLVCCIHGLLYGTLYAPAQAIIFGLNFEQTIAWIIAGLPFDLIHGVSNLFTGALVIPLTDLLCKLSKRASII